MRVLGAERSGEGPQQMKMPIIIQTETADGDFMRQRTYCAGLCKTALSGDFHQPRIPLADRTRSFGTEDGEALSKLACKGLTGSLESNDWSQSAGGIPSCQPL